MSDELVKRLRDLGDHASFEPHMHHTAADRIEELENRLEKEMSDLDAADRRITRLQARIQELEERLKAATDDAKEAETYAGELEANLAKALGEMRKVDEYLTRLQTPNTEPLNSVNSCGSKELRGQYTAAVRNEAREYWASLGNTIAELTGGKDE